MSSHSSQVNRAGSRPRASALLALALAFAGSILAPTSIAAASPATSTPSTAAATITVRAYFLMRSHGSTLYLTPVLRTVPSTTAVATAAVRQLLARPLSTEPDLATAIPAGTTLRSIAIHQSTATVDLNGRFAKSTSTIGMRRRLAQLVYTVTQFKNVDTVLLKLDGKPLSTIGGIHISSGMHRSTFRAQLPPIFVDRPAWRGTLLSGGHVSGLANVFEAQFRLRLLAANGTVLLDRAVHATCGTGCWGRFDVTVAYTVATAQWGTLRVYDRSERDGSVIDVRDYPVWLKP